MISCSFGPGWLPRMTAIGSIREILRLFSEPEPGATGFVLRFLAVSDPTRPVQPSGMIPTVSPLAWSNATGLPLLSVLADDWAIIQGVW
jgi:hypothetical protein